MRADLPLALVHEVFQISMGWWNCHIHDFEAHGRHFGDIEAADRDKAVEDDMKFTLSDLIENTGDEFLYHYDFGDGWQHRVVLEEVLHYETDGWVVCIVGRRACPPEDVGGVEGYARFIDLVEDPQNEGRVEQLEWLGSEFDPDSFDVRGVNLRLTLLQERIANASVEG